MYHANHVFVKEAAHRMAHFLALESGALVGRTKAGLATCCSKLDYLLSRYMPLASSEIVKRKGFVLGARNLVSSAIVARSEAL